MIVTLGRPTFTHQAGVVYGYVLCGLYIGVRGHAASMCSGS